MSQRVLLYVEDDLNDVDLIALALSTAKSSLRMETVSDGASAIAYLAGFAKYSNRHQYPMPDIVLLDLTLRGMNGFGVLRWMLHQPPGTMPPVIIFSHSRQEVDVRQARELGANCFVSKPIDPESAVALVRSLEGLVEKVKSLPDPQLDFPTEILPPELPPTLPAQV